MRRWFVVLMLCLLPVQLVWASVAPYCAHEPEMAGAASRHFGHHEHQHRAGGAVATALDSDGSLADHADCHGCNLAGSLMPLAPPGGMPALAREAIAMPAAVPYSSHIPCAPERPDRAELSAAARFGGEVEFRPLPG